MALITNSRVCEDNVLYTLKLDFDEAEELHGCLSPIHLVQEKKVIVQSSIYERGRNGATKYFLIPKELRKNVCLKGKVRCLRQDSKEKTVWTYIIDKLE